VPLSAGPCDDWRGALKAGFADPARMRFAGSYPTACGEQAWPLADPAPASYNARLVAGPVARDGRQPDRQRARGPGARPARPSFELKSPPLLEVVREINKFSNNVMAQQLFLTLALQRRPAAPGLAGGGPRAPAALGDASAWATRAPNWWSTTARGCRARAGLGAAAGAAAAAGARRPLGGRADELAADRRRRRHLAPRPAASRPGPPEDRLAARRGGLAGYVLSDSGRRYVLVAIINHPQAGAARPALDALVQWTLRDAPAR
jgi:D-alanyl-D-alanine carboxypeptidase/D-alanyl-D-alanine-endopeptidase (penicillin-binding protein 4)